MANNKSKRPQTKRPAQRRGRAPRQGAVARRAIVPKPTRARTSIRDVQRVCSITDPFCSHANGAKLFSNSTARTLPQQFHTRVAINTDTNGNSAMLILPSYNLLYGFGAVTSGTATYSTLTGAGPSMAAASFRIVSWGIKLRKISAPLYASGMLRIRTFGAKTGSTLVSSSVSTYNCDAFEDVPLADAHEVCVIGKRLDYSYAKFVTLGHANPTANVGDWISPGWGAVQIAVEGAPVSTAVLDVEFFFNYEITLPDDDALAQLATPPLPDHPIATAAANTVYSTSRNIFREGMRAASQYLEKRAAMAIGSFFGGPAGAGAMALMVD